MSERTTLPRRANGIRALAAEMGATLASKTLARQAVSDRISYALAFALGCLVFAAGGWYGAALGACFYGWRAHRSYRAWRAAA